MADGPPHAQILGGRAAVTFVNALLTTRSTFRAEGWTRETSQIGFGKIVFSLEVRLSWMPAVTNQVSQGEPSTP